MRKNFGPNNWMYPMPVLIVSAYAKDGSVNAMNAAWGNISRANQISVTINHGHKTTKNVLEKQAFTVSFANRANMAACDYLGMESGNDVKNKMEKAGLHFTKSEFVDAPVVDELPMCLECRVLSYDPDVNRLIGEIVNICADESILDAEGNIDPKKLDPLIFDPVHHHYYTLGEKAGDALGEGKKLI